MTLYNKIIYHGQFLLIGAVCLLRKCWLSRSVRRARWLAYWEAEPDPDWDLAHLFYRADVRWSRPEADLAVEFIRGVRNAAVPAAIIQASADFYGSNVHPGEA
jgi:hypothetical protein